MVVEVLELVTATSRCTGATGGGTSSPCPRARLIDEVTVVSSVSPVRWIDGAVGGESLASAALVGAAASSPHSAMREKAAGSTAVVRGPSSVPETAVTTGVANVPCGSSYGVTRSPRSDVSRCRRNVRSKTSMACASRHVASCARTPRPVHGRPSSRRRTTTLHLHNLPKV